MWKEKALKHAIEEMPNESCGLLAIKKGKEITSPIKINNGYLIIKVNEVRKIREKINFDEELNKLINLESEKELNRLGYIYFNKIKKRIFISEN